MDEIATELLGGLNANSRILSVDSVVSVLSAHDDTLIAHTDAIANKFSDLSTALVAQINSDSTFKSALKTALDIA